MIREKTTFVIGAGASVEFGLPVGTQLAAEIKQTAKMPGRNISSMYSAYMRDFLYEKFKGDAERSEVIKAINAIHQGIHTAVSIDAFIHRHRSSEAIQRFGKALIALEVLKAENNSTLWAEHWNAFQTDPDRVVGSNYGGAKLVNPDYTWIGHFFRVLCDGIDNPHDVGKNINIICFNYDRCIEHYLTQNLAAAYRIDLNTALDIVENHINIIHPYGYLGKLSTVVNGRDGDRISYGYEIPQSWFDIEDISGNIRTYTEQSHDADTVQRIHRAMVDCHNLIFLGFGFNNQNLDLLRVKHILQDDLAPKNIYATAVGIHSQVDETLKRRILDLFESGKKAHDHWKSHVHIEYGQGCKELFRIHDMNFTRFTQSGVFIDEVDGAKTARIERLRPRVRLEDQSESLRV
ncbi:SIR2 family protein [Ensifer aridi]|uniref:SIR2 family protein n=1 Tax=Ensifer aridi TaxID=1708715 RepID=UPI00358DDBCB